MTIIFEKKTPTQVVISCSCKRTISAPFYWEVDSVAVCDECYNDNYLHLIKCIINDCNEFGEIQSFSNGMCESCDEVNSPLSPEDQEGWEHNIRQWNEC